MGIFTCHARAFTFRFLTSALIRRFECPAPVAICSVGWWFNRLICCSWASKKKVNVELITWVWSSLFLSFALEIQMCFCTSYSPELSSEKEEEEERQRKTRVHQYQSINHDVSYARRGRREKNRIKYRHNGYRCREAVCLHIQTTKNSYNNQRSMYKHSSLLRTGGKKSFGRSVVRTNSMTEIKNWSDRSQPSGKDERRPFCSNRHTHTNGIKTNQQTRRNKTKIIRLFLSLIYLRTYQHMPILLSLYNLLDRQTEFIRFIRYRNIVCARLMLP